MKFTITTPLLFALTACSSSLVNVGAQDEPEAVPIMADEGGAGGDLGQFLNDTITDVIDSIESSTLGKFISCLGDDDTLRSNADFAAAEDAYYASAKYAEQKSSSATSDGDSSSMEEYTVTVGSDELAAYESACKALEGSVWESAPSWTGTCMDDGNSVTLTYPNGYGLCYPDTEACKGFGEWYVTTWETFFTGLQEEGVTCSSDGMPLSAAASSFASKAVTAAGVVAAIAALA